MSQKHAPSAHARARRKKKRLWDRHPEDWYVEPDWVNDCLFRHEEFIGRIHDPACGVGRIVRAARRAGHRATGSDIVTRARGFKVGSFFEQTRPVENICCNVPFRFAMAFTGHALNLAERKVALLLPTAWINGEARSRWLSKTPLKRVWHITPRPSMPPGEVVMKATQSISNGTTDYSYFVWEHGYTGEPLTGWLRRGDLISEISVPAPGSTAQPVRTKGHGQ